MNNYQRQSYRKMLLFCRDEELDLDYLAFESDTSLLTHMFGSICTAQFSSFKPPLKDKDYSHWMTILSKPAIVSIDASQEVKKQLVNNLQNNYNITVRPNLSSHSFICGNQTIMIKLVEDLLLEATIVRIRINFYGIKQPLISILNNLSFFEKDYNIQKIEADIGKTFFKEIHCIPLIKKFKGSKTSAVKKFPMLTTLGGGFGSLSIKSQDLQIKVYAHLVHALKSGRSEVYATIPKTKRHIKNEKRFSQQA